MAGQTVSFQSATISAASATGYITVASAAGYFTNAIVRLFKSGQPSVQGRITSVDYSTNQMGIRLDGAVVVYQNSDVSAYNGGTIYQDSQFIYGLEQISGASVDAVSINTSAPNTWSKAQRGAVTALTSSGGSIAINLADGNNFSHTMTENTTLAAPSNAVAGQTFTIVITNHASSPKTLAYNAFWKFAGGSIPTLTATNGAVDVLTGYVCSAGFAVASLIKGVA